MARIQPHLPIVAQKTLETVAKMLVMARKKRKWRQIDIAERLGLTRQTVSRMEKGDPRIAVGIYFSAAWLLDVPIFPGMQARDQASKSMLSEFIKLFEDNLPQRIAVKKEKPVDDNF